MKKPVLHTIGHSTRSIDEFLELLAAHGIQELVDVRTIPRSRHDPQYEQAALRRSLKSAHIRYHHLRALGGRRHTHADSPNTGWINASFRGYADYMQTEGGSPRAVTARSSPTRWRSMDGGSCISRAGAPPNFTAGRGS